MCLCDTQIHLYIDTFWYNFLRNLAEAYFFGPPCYIWMARVLQAATVCRCVYKTDWYTRLISGLYAASTAWHGLGHVELLDWSMLRDKLTRSVVPGHGIINVHRCRRVFVKRFTKLSNVWFFLRKRLSLFKLHAFDETRTAHKRFFDCQLI